MSKHPPCIYPSGGQFPTVNSFGAQPVANTKRQINLYRFDLNFPIHLCLKTPAQPVIAKTGIPSTHRSDLENSCFHGNGGGVNENENKKFILKKQEVSNQTGITVNSADTQPVAGTKRQIRLFEIYKTVRRIVFLGAILYSGCPRSANLSSFCHQLWSSPPPTLTLQVQKSYTNPLTAVFIEALLKAEQRGWLSRPNETEDFQRGAEDMIGFLERQATAREQVVLTRLEIPLKTALNQLPHIMKFLSEIPDSPSVFYFQETAFAVLAVFSKHLPALLKERNPSYTAWQKINPILKNISQFNPNKPYFSLYKIKRSIEMYFSLKEFNHARYL